MSDHTSAEIFGNIFEMLARFKAQGVDVAKEAEYFWEKTREYDFNDYQMCADKALIELGFAKKGEHSDYPGEKVVLYHRSGRWEP